jgi:hypothetical protein
MYVMDSPHFPGESNPSLEEELRAWLEDFESLSKLQVGLERVAIRQKLALIKDLRSRGNSLRARLNSTKDIRPDSSAPAFQERFPQIDSLEAEFRSALVGRIYDQEPEHSDFHISDPQKSRDEEEPIPEVLSLTTSQGTTTDGVVAIISLFFAVCGLAMIPFVISIFNQPYFTLTPEGLDQTILLYASDTLPEVGREKFSIAHKVSEMELLREKAALLLFPPVFITMGSIFFWISLHFAGVQKIELDGRNLRIQTVFDGIKLEKKYRLKRNARAKLEITSYRRGFRLNYEPDSIELPIEGGGSIKIAYGSTKEELDVHLKKINRYLEKTVAEVTPHLSGSI